MQIQMLDQLTRQFLELYAAKDIDSISHMFSDHIVLKDWNHEVFGKEAAIKEFQKNFDDARHLSIAIKGIYFSGFTAAAEIDVTVNDAMLGIVDVISFDETNSVTSVIAYRAF